MSVPFEALFMALRRNREQMRTSSSQAYRQLTAPVQSSEQMSKRSLEIPVSKQVLLRKYSV